MLRYVAAYAIIAMGATLLGYNGFAFGTIDAARSCASHFSVCLSPHISSDWYALLGYPP